MNIFYFRFDICYLLFGAVFTDSEGANDKDILKIQDRS
jgi:hypothetical protein